MDMNRMMPYVKRLFALLLLLCCMSGAEAGNRFATAKLEQLAQLIPQVGFDTLSPGLHTEYRFQGRGLKIRVNRWQEVEHIGFNFFDTLMAAEYPLVCDFLERYFLDLTVSDDPDKFLRMTIDDFLIEYGNFETIFSVRPTDQMVVTTIDLRKYQVTFRRKGATILSYIFNMDYQMLVGSNSIELEQNYLRTVLREVQHAPAIEERCPAELDTCMGTYCAVPGSSYMLEAVHSGRYYVHNDCEWLPVCSARKPQESAYNILLSPVAIGDFVFDIDLDMYGYKKQSFSVPMSQWVAKTMAEGCTLYLGIKEIKDNVVKATLFCPNRQGGYCHVVSVELPLKAIQKRGGSVHGRMYAYVPMHNISPRYFKLK